MSTATVVDDTRGLWSRGLRAEVVGVMALMTFIAFETYAVITALPLVVSSLGGDAWYSFAFAATVATGLLGMVVGGGWADRSGVLKPLAAGGALFLAGLLLCTAAPTMSVFIVGRLLQGLGGGVDSVVLYVFIARAIPDRLRPRMFGLLVTAWLLPAVLGPIVTGVMVDRLHWRAVFGIVLVGSALALSLLLRAARRMATTQRDVPVVDSRVRWAGLASLGIVGLHLSGHQPIPVLVTGTVVAGLLTLVAARRILPVGTFRLRPGPPRLVALKGLLGATVAATDVYLTHYLQRELGYTPTAAGAVVAIGALGWFGGSILQGRAHSGGSIDLRVPAGLVALGPVTALGLVMGVATVPIAVIGAILMGVGMGIAYPQITSRALDQSADHAHGETSSGLQTVEQLSTSTLIAATGALLALQPRTGYALSYALIVLVGTSAIVVTSRRHRGGMGV